MTEIGTETAIVVASPSSRWTWRNFKRFLDERTRRAQAAEDEKARREQQESLPQSSVSNVVPRERLDVYMRTRTRPPFVLRDDYVPADNLVAPMFEERLGYKKKGDYALQFLAIQLLSGLANAMFLFLIASGLTLIFGVTRIVNFAHGSFYMLAAYATYSLVAALPLEGRRPSTWGALLAALPWRSRGGLFEVALLRRVYRAPELSSSCSHSPWCSWLTDVVTLSGARTTRRARARRASAGRCRSSGQLFPTSTSL